MSSAYRQRAGWLDEASSAAAATTPLVRAWVAHEVRFGRAEATLREALEEARRDAAERLRKKAETASEAGATARRGLRREAVLGRRAMVQELLAETGRRMATRIGEWLRLAEPLLGEADTWLASIAGAADEAQRRAGAYEARIAEADRVASDARRDRSGLAARIDRLEGLTPTAGSLGGGPVTDGGVAEPATPLARAAHRARDVKPVVTRSLDTARSLTEPGEGQVLVPQDGWRAQAERALADGRAAKRQAETALGALRLAVDDLEAARAQVAALTVEEAVARCADRLETMQAVIAEATRDAEAVEEVAAAGRRLRARLERVVRESKGLAASMKRSAADLETFVELEASLEEYLETAGPPGAGAAGPAAVPAGADPARVAQELTVRAARAALGVEAMDRRALAEQMRRSVLERSAFLAVRYPDYLEATEALRAKVAGLRTAAARQAAAGEGRARSSAELFATIEPAPDPFDPATWQGAPSAAGKPAAAADEWTVEWSVATPDGEARRAAAEHERAGLAAALGLAEETAGGELDWLAEQPPLLDGKTWFCLVRSADGRLRLRADGLVLLSVPGERPGFGPGGPPTATESRLRGDDGRPIWWAEGEQPERLDQRVWRLARPVSALLLDATRTFRRWRTGDDGWISDWGIVAADFVVEHEPPKAKRCSVELGEVPPDRYGFEFEQRAALLAPDAVEIVVLREGVEERYAVQAGDEIARLPEGCRLVAVRPGAEVSCTLFSRPGFRGHADEVRQPVALTPPFAEPAGTAAPAPSPPRSLRVGDRPGHGLLDRDWVIRCDNGAGELPLLATNFAPEPRLVTLGRLATTGSFRIVASDPAALARCLARLRPDAGVEVGGMRLQSAWNHWFLSHAHDRARFRPGPEAPAARLELAGDRFASIDGLDVPADVERLEVECRLDSPPGQAAWIASWRRPASAPSRPTGRRVDAWGLRLRGNSVELVVHERDASGASAQRKIQVERPPSATALAIVARWSPEPTFGEGTDARPLDLRVESLDPAGDDRAAPPPPSYFETTKSGAEPPRAGELDLGPRPGGRRFQLRAFRCFATPRPAAGEAPQRRRLVDLEPRPAGRLLRDLSGRDRHAVLSAGAAPETPPEPTPDTLLGATLRPCDPEPGTAPEVGSVTLELWADEPGEGRRDLCIDERGELRWIARTGRGDGARPAVLRPLAYLAHPIDGLGQAAAGDDERRGRAGEAVLKSYVRGLGWKVLDEAERAARGLPATVSEADLLDGEEWRDALTRAWLRRGSHLRPADPGRARRHLAALGLDKRATAGREGGAWGPEASATDLGRGLRQLFDDLVGVPRDDPGDRARAVLQTHGLKWVVPGARWRGSDAEIDELRASADRLLAAPRAADAERQRAADEFLEALLGLGLHLEDRRWESDLERLAGELIELAGDGVEDEKETTRRRRRWRKLRRLGLAATVRLQPTAPIVERWLEAVRRAAGELVPRRSSTESRWIALEQLDALAAERTALGTLLPHLDKGWLSRAMSLAADSGGPGIEELQAPERGLRRTLRCWGSASDRRRPALAATPGTGARLDWSVDGRPIPPCPLRLEATLELRSGPFADRPGVWRSGVPVLELAPGVELTLRRRDAAAELLTGLGGLGLGLADDRWDDRLDKLAGKLVWLADRQIADLADGSRQPAAAARRLGKLGVRRVGEPGDGGWTGTPNELLRLRRCAERLLNPNPWAWSLAGGRVLPGSATAADDRTLGDDAGPQRISLRAALRAADGPGTASGARPATAADAGRPAPPAVVLSEIRLAARPAERRPAAIAAAVDGQAPTPVPPEEDGTAYLLRLHLPLTEGSGPVVLDASGFGGAAGLHECSWVGVPAELGEPPEEEKVSR